MEYSATSSGGKSIAQTDHHRGRTKRRLLQHTTVGHLFFVFFFPFAFFFLHSLVCYSTGEQLRL